MALRATEKQKENREKLFSKIDGVKNSQNLVKNQIRSKIQFNFKIDENLSNPNQLLLEKLSQSIEGKFQTLNLH